ncbi:endosomal/lysosomal proton channel TMEM175-like [Hydra vulgaris]|uniref:Endosomal/lysosomal proton channel TMEM175 n=1 Tax=Hydra vulgaris TaxID=6087 RepID=A0ABM4DLV3_HYDVU
MEIGVKNENVNSITSIKEATSSSLSVHTLNRSASEPNINLSVDKEFSIDTVRKKRTASLLSMDSREKLKHLDEHYDFHMNEIMPESLHRGDLVSPQRMLGYADALMATCATFLVIPLRNFKKMTPGSSLAEYVYVNRMEFVMFFLGYLVVLTIWESINIRSLFIKRVDDMLLFMTMFSMFITSLLPFSLSLEGHYPGEQISVWLSCSLLAILELTDFLIVWYAMEQPSVLHFELHTWTKPEQRRFRNVLFLNNLVNILFIILGSFSILLSHALAWVFISMLVLMPSLRKLYFYVKRHTISHTKMEKSQFFFHLTKGNISNERITAMSDAAFAIIACILILDITVEEFPTYENVKKHGLSYELIHMRKEFYIYFGIFAVVSMLWYSNHGVLHLFKTSNVIVIYFQKFSLAFACLTPLAGNMVISFASDGNTNAQKSILMSSMVIFFSSFFNLMIMLYGYYTKDKFLHTWAVGNKNLNKYQQKYTFLKTANIPFWSLACTMGSFLPESVVFYIMCVSFCGSILTFIILKLIFIRLIGREKFILHNRFTDVVINVETTDEQ